MNWLHVEVNKNISINESKKIEDIDLFFTIKCIQYKKNKKSLIIFRIIWNNKKKTNNKIMLVEYIFINIRLIKRYRDVDLINIILHYLWD